MSTQAAPRKKTTVLSLRKKKRNSVPITMMTAYDYPSARSIEDAQLDMILVGDSLGMVVLGYDNTLSVTMDDMIHHCKAVARGAKTPMLVGDMPFMSYQVDVKEAVRNAGRLLAEGNMDAIKLEGGIEMADTVRAIVNVGIPVVGHIGLTPQSVNQLGGFKVQGRKATAAAKLLEDAYAMQDAGCCALVLEAVPDRIARYISDVLDIPTIGIGGGNGCDGQVLVYHDTLGFFDKFTPRFVKQYGQLNTVIAEALNNYKDEVESRAFPAPEHSFTMKDEEWDAFLDLVEPKIEAKDFFGMGANR